ncbi:LacI family DNA-binding transcriptional regulator [Paenibacillus hodogayensis]|uniref:LacI family DNA-binding transcriptional regulator n=1 Tax=Paenibacillus hodogayensis TaxID=279208 RepID=A0ABV5VVA4_9BACL
MVTQKDIADYVGVSRTAVSLVLNNAPNSTVSEKTRALILKAAKEMGYKDTEVKPKICYVFYNRESNDPRYLQHLKITEAAAARFGYTLLFMSIRPNPQDHQRLNELARSQDTAGIIVSGLLDETVIGILEESKVPHLYFGCTERTDIHVVVSNHHKAAYLAVRQLIELGHRRIAFFSGSLGLLVNKRELAGYTEALEEAGIEIDKSLIQTGKEEDGDELCNRLHEMNIEYTAAYCTNTIIQFGVLQGLKRLGIDVPGEISLIGNEFTELVRLSVPQLTTMLHGGSQKEIPVLRLIDIIQRKRTDILNEYISDYELFPGGTLAKCRE